MKQSQIFLKTIKDVPAEETAINAQLLLKAGYIDKLMSGVYTYLPLGFLVLEKIKKIIREEMVKIGGQEIFMPALQPKSIWEETKRWDSMKNILFQFKGRGGTDLCLGATHEEVIVDLTRKRINSYKDLPVALFQIQDKFRNEPRAKSGLLRGREFSMKDLYSFHADQDNLDEYYEEAKQAYLNIFERLGLAAKVVEASGGSFSSEYSHEFQVLTDSGEDTIFWCDCGWAQNKEVCQIKAGHKCPKCKKGVIQESSGIEIGNIFKLGQKYSKDMNLTFANQGGKKDYIYMGCYGIGPSRIMGSIVEVHHDQHGIIWPASIAPFQIHLLLLDNKQPQLLNLANSLYEKLDKLGYSVLFDDRIESPGIKLKEADLIGLPVRLVISEKNQGLIEYKLRSNQEIVKVKEEELFNKLTAM
ncbi:MAG: hypothetical protein EPN88_17435 [Bacteroidetes bacterium]|nr:MAG: hypothetical protein EPN88_17435 [Bacteroidota bacterium]